MIFLLKDMMEKTHIVASGHNHIVAHQRGQVVETLLTEIVVPKVAVGVALHIGIQSVDFRTEDSFGVLCGKFLEPLFGNGS